MLKFCTGGSFKRNVWRPLTPVSASFGLKVIASVCHNRSHAVVHNKKSPIARCTIGLFEMLEITALQTHLICGRP